MKEKAPPVNHRQPTRRPKRWIQSTHIERGALRRQLGVPAGATIPLEVLRRAAEAPGKLGKRAQLAITLRGLRRGRSRMRPMTRAEVRATTARVARYERRGKP